MLEDLIVEHPNYIEAYDWLARVHQMLGVNDAAESVLLRATTLSPNSAVRQNALGNAALRCGHADIAEKAMLRAIKLGEQSALKSVAPYLGLARVHSVSNRHQEALKLLGEVAQKFSSDDAKLQARVEEVHVLHLSGDAKRANEVAQEVLARVQGGEQNLSPGTTIDLAETFMKMGNCSEATQLLQFVVRNNDEEENIGARAQAVFDNAGMGEDGLALLGQSRQLAREAMNQGVGLLAAGKLTEALECMRSACTQMPRNPRVLLNLAYVLIVMLEKNGWRRDVEDEARKAIVLARSIAPGNKRTGELLTRLETVANLRQATSTPAPPKS
jgi:Flp pilus assembly protein TadD